jgi:putative transcriptional regulator
MTIAHHPTDVTLAALAAGTLDEARALVVTVHVSLCPHCRAALDDYERVGGALLSSASPAPMRPGALDRAMAQLTATPLPSDRPAGRMVAAGAQDENLPAPLGHYALGRWRSIGRGVQWRSVDVATDDDVHVFMLKAAGGTRLPRHRHSGTEWTCVFRGAFRHELGRFGPGDFDEADESVEHDPTVEPGDPCICLVALQGNIRLQGFVGRLIQPFIRL